MEKEPETPLAPAAEATEAAPAMYQPLNAPERPLPDDDDPNETFLASYTRPHSFLD